MGSGTGVHDTVCKPAIKPAEAGSELGYCPKGLRRRFPKLTEASHARIVGVPRRKSLFFNVGSANRVVHPWETAGDQEKLNESRRLEG